MGCGTTSACAENTPKRLTLGVVDGNYLRVRGEYYLAVLLLLVVLELPPRARRIRFVRVVFFQQLGTTSACAENTIICSSMACTCRNYLRVRGEYKTVWGGIVRYSELPPRARRIQQCAAESRGHGGTTSACAENTPCAPLNRSSDQNYLRVRGEYWGETHVNETLAELPPRARRIREVTTSSVRKIGTTSACAENTLNELGLL